MTRVTLAVALVAVALTAVLLIAVQTSAGPEKIVFPDNFKSGVLYTTVDRYDVKQYRELYASSQAAVDAMKAGKPLPDRTVLTIVQYKAQVDAQGNPVKDANGRFLKGDLVGYGVMEKRQGWGAEYPVDLRNGEWEYSAFTPDQKFNDKANFKGCFQCHKPHEKMDFVISLAKVKGGDGAAGGAADVTIAGFAFGPGKLEVAPGKPVTWVNNDDSPHQISMTTGTTQSRGPVLTKGQSYAQAFSTPGVYDYMCGLHPSMKGQVEVK